MRVAVTLNLYIVRQFLKAFGMALGTIMGVVYLFDVIELLRISSTHGHVGFVTLLELGLLKAPQMLETILPFVILIAAMGCFWTMTRTRELVVARASGISVWQIMTPVLLAVFLIGVLEVTLFNPIAADLYRTVERTEDRLALSGPASPLLFGESGLWLRESQNNQEVWVHATSVRQDGTSLKLRGVSLIFSDSQTRFLYRIEAVLGELHPGYFHLTDVRTLKPGAAVEHQDSMDFATQLTLARIEDNFASPQTLSFWELPGFISFFESAGFSASRQRLYFQSLLSMPLLLCAMLLLAAVFSLSPNLRSGGLMNRLAGAAAAGFVFYFFSRVVYALGVSATLPVALAAWSPAIVAGLIGTGVLFHLEDG